MNNMVQHLTRGPSPDLKGYQIESGSLDNVKKMLQLQLEELEMITSMFPNPGEIILTDQSVVADINEFMNGKTSTVPLHLDYTINLTIDDFKLELCVNLASTYPETEPEIFVRSNQLIRNQQTQINSDLGDYIRSLDKGELCICSIVIWLQENSLNYYQKTNACTKKQNSKENRESFSRLWIYSHHIYNKTKRKEILTQALELDLTGFCLPGKPGIICVEGPSSSCNQWWQSMRSMTWQKIMCKKAEEETIKPGEDCDSHRKFGKFQEISFVNENTTGKDQGKHMNMGELYQYLRDHDCGEVFKDYFGIDGRCGDA